ncbi:MAG: hypothetical protein ACYC4I_00985 [Minisyncoccota bacterium]
MRFSSATILMLMLLLPATVSAQSLDSSMGNTDPFTVSVNPQYPAPRGQAVLSFLSSTLDLTNATLAVSLGGKQIYQGSVQPVSIPLGKTGVPVSVSVKMTSAGTSYSQSVVIQPEDVSLIAEPLSSAPVLYPGKPLVPLSGNTRIVAVANFKDAAGKVLDPEALSYSWTVDGTQIANSSGVGKQAIVVASPLQYRERSVSVTVHSQAGSLVGGASLSLEPLSASVRIYENDPLLGIRFDHALSGTYAIAGTEASLYAAPFSLPLVSGTPILQWFLNGTAAQTGSLITLHPSGSGQGSASLSLTASADSSVAAAASLSLSFGGQPSTNFFGL